MSTEEDLHGVKYKRESASGRGPTGGDQRHWRLQKKTTETEARASLAKVYACEDSGWSIPGKMWMPTNQIRAISAHAHLSRELRARAPSGISGYIKSAE